MSFPLLRGSLYRHYNSQKIYQILVPNAIDADTGKKMVVYKDVVERMIWIRPEEQFLGKVVHGGELRSRFTKVPVHGLYNYNPLQS